MKPAPFHYHRPRTVDEAFALLKEYGGDGKILAGGQSLIPLMNFRLARPAHLIDINFIDGLDYVEQEDGRARFGCRVRQSRLANDPSVRGLSPLLAEASTFVGYSQTRNRGTLCGSLAHADPAAELPAVLVALDGSVTIGSVRSRRSVAAKDFFISYLTTALAPDEMVLEASIPDMPKGAGWSFVEFARRFGDFALVGVCAIVVPSNGKIRNLRIALTGVGERPWRDRELEQSAIGMETSENSYRQIGAEIAAKIDPASDIHAAASGRRSLAAVLTSKALAGATSRAARS